MLEQKGVNGMSMSLQTFLEFEEKSLRTGVPLTDTSKNIEIFGVLQLMKEMNKKIISFERRINPTPIQTTLAIFSPSTNPQPIQPMSLMTQSYYIFC